jgi:flagellar assembly protein FliH
MGRIAKNVRFRVERYQLHVPEIPPPPPEVTDADDLGSSDVHPFGEADAFLHERPAPEPPAPTIDVEAIRAQAQTIVDTAQRNAEALLLDAHDRARTLVEEAASRADAIANESRKRGHDEGFAAGRSDADRDMTVMLTTMRGLLEMARAERQKLIQNAEPELVRLALGIAERVLQQQVALDRGVVVEMAKTAIGRLIDRDTVTVRVNPADLERMRDHRDDLIAIGDIRNLRVIEDQRVDRGGVVVDTAAGTIDARISTQLEEARKVLHIEDDVIVEPAPAEQPRKTDLPAARAS